MARNSTAWYLIVAASVTGGCAATDAAQSIPTTTSIPVVSANHPSPAAPTTTSGSAPETLSPCGEIGSSATPPDCRLQSNDAVGARFEVRRGALGGKTTIAIDVYGSDGVRTQTLTERNVAHPSDPILRDVDGDGRDELLVPIHLDTVNSRFAVYHTSGDAIELHRAGELTGIGIDTTADGYVVSPMRYDYASWNVEFWRLTEDALAPIVIAQVRLRDTEAGAPTASDCTVVDAGGLHTTGLSSLDEARDRFCAEPSVQRVMRR